MELLNEDQRVLKTYTLKSESGGGLGEITYNRYYRLLSNETDVYTHRAGAHALQLAERHIMLGPVTELASVSFVVSNGNDPTQNFQAFCAFDGGAGGRHVDDYNLPVPYPVVLRLRKFCTYGKSSSLFFRGVLRESDIIRESDGRVYLRGDYDSAGLSASYFNFFAFQGGPPLIVPHFNQHEIIPAGYRIIERFGEPEAIRLTSIPDAQKRKTYVALGYAAQARGGLNAMVFAGQMFQALADAGGDFINGAAAQDAENRFGAFVGIFEGLLDYYTDGVELSDAHCWRPSSGLDPFSNYAQSVLEKCKERGDAMLEQWQNYVRGPEGELRYQDLQSSYEQFGAICGLYMIFLENERFTGTPKYIPRALSNCRGTSLAI